MNKAKPTFGGAHRIPEYYQTVNAAIKLGRGNCKTLREIAEQMDKDGLDTPSGKQWSKDLVAAYLKSVAYKSDI